MTEQMVYHSILWRRLDMPGHEAARIFADRSGWRLSGAAVFAYQQMPCRLDYAIHCDLAWRTQAAQVTGWVGERDIEIDLLVGPDRRWQLNGAEQPAVAGCIDLDLNFSPLTNLLPIRRLNLAVGQSAHVRAAWLRFPEFNLEALEQVYLRKAPYTYRYQSATGSFVAELQVNEAGFVIDYPNFNVQES